MEILLYFLLTVHIITCLLIVFVVLMQRPRSEGLGAAFGGGVTENIFGAQTTNVLAKFTTYLGGFFFLVTLALAMVYARLNASNETGVQRELQESSTPAVPSPSPTPATAPAAATPVATPTPAAAEPTATPATDAVTSEAAATPEPTPAADMPAEPVEAPAAP